MPIYGNDAINAFLKLNLHSLASSGFHILVNTAKQKCSPSNKQRRSKKVRSCW